MSAAEGLAPDSGERYDGVEIPSLDGLACAEDDDNGFRFGSDMDLRRIHGTDALIPRQDQNGDERARFACYGTSPIVVNVEGIEATAPHFVTSTSLFEDVADPSAVLTQIVTETVDLSGSYDRAWQGEPQDLSTGDLAIQCQSSLALSVHMTTCFWANYGAAGLVDFFPPTGAPLPPEEAASQTQAFVTAALSRSSLALSRGRASGG
jgi:hypothetical protein